MNLDKYAALTNASHESYEFLSSGPRGTIKKVVNYTEIEPGVYNLGFGDWDEVLQEVKDNTRSNNADREKVLATVGSTVIDFMDHHPQAIIIAEGETPAKTRLYQMGINLNSHLIGQLFDIEGFTGTGWETFTKGRNYRAFALRLKNS